MILRCLEMFLGICIAVYGAVPLHQKNNTLHSFAVALTFRSEFKDESEPSSLLLKSTEYDWIMLFYVVLVFWSWHLVTAVQRQRRTCIDYIHTVPGFCLQFGRKQQHNACRFVGNACNTCQQLRERHKLHGSLCASCYSCLTLLKGLQPPKLRDPNLGGHACIVQSLACRLYRPAIRQMRLARWHIQVIGPPLPFSNNNWYLA